MPERRAGYVAGIGWAALSVVAGVMVPKPPALDAPTSAVSAFLAGHHRGLLAGSTTSAVAALLLLPFVVTLSLRFTEDWMARLAQSTASVLVATGLLGGVLQAVLAGSSGNLDPGAAAAAYRLVLAVFYAAPPLAAALLLWSVSLGLRESGTPTWIGISAGVLAVISLVGGVGGLLGGSGAMGILGLAGFLLTVAWVLVTSVVLLRRSARVGASGAPRPSYSAS